MNNGRLMVAVSSICSARSEPCSKPFPPDLFFFGKTMVDRPRITPCSFLKSSPYTSPIPIDFRGVKHPLNGRLFFHSPRIQNRRSDGIRNCFRAKNPFLAHFINLKRPLSPLLATTATRKESHFYSFGSLQNSRLH